MLLSVERPPRGSLCLWMTRGHAAALYGLVHAVLPASDWNMCKRTIVVPQELGRPCRSSANSRLEIPGDQLPALAAHSSARERKQRVYPRYRQAKETKCGGTGGRKSQRFDSTVEAGELASEDPVEESEASAGRPDRGKHAEHIEVLMHVPVTRLDSLGDHCGWQTCRLRNRMR